ncbi:hypothetical protein RchiOBHm_Chr4g0390881 [Rosa chinensis]|uniref:Uncharacterized protein n=1 Tax=Rosa chinensis TaxID=74649 RepID=A0A2P6QQB4_ROSCH|nr:hypothetical protein RchiOBHm_Chr4g0390881 [Rosa chinensis]
MMDVNLLRQSSDGTTLHIVVNHLKAQRHVCNTHEDIHRWCLKVWFSGFDNPLEARHGTAYQNTLKEDFWLGAFLERSEDKGN